MPEWELAQVNIGRLRAPVDAPEIAGFVEMLEPINAIADATPGFVWRLQTEDGNATAVRVDDDPLIAINLSVWASVEPLADFVYRSAHTDVMRRRREWFHKMDVYTTLWWVPAGHRPSTDEAMAKLAHLREHGPTADAFTFRHPFPPPGSDATVETDQRWNCRA
jgi:uncharacterized protein DUF3291